MSSQDRFTLIMFALALVVAILGWLLRTLFASLRADIRANTKATEQNTAELAHLAERVARLEGPPRPPPRRR